MNRQIIFLAIVFCYFFTFSQDDQDSFKASDGEKTLEVQFVPFGNNPININGIRARWFSSDTRALRLNVFVGLDSDTDIIQQEDSGAGLEELKSVTTEFAVSIRPGFENHIHVSDKLSPYFGAEVELAYQSFSDKVEQQNGSTVNYINTTNDFRSGFVRLGANAIAGLDYYVAKKLYLGTEFGFGFSYTGFLSVKVKSDISGFTEPDPEKQGSAFDLGPNVVAQIRLGYAF